MNNKTEVTVTLELSPSMKEKGFIFSILHIRDGKDQMDDKNRLVNRITPFESASEAKLSSIIEYDKNIGFQFKCFADIPDSTYTDEELFSFFNEEGFEDVSKDGGLNRFWFILPDYGTCDTIDGFINNYYYPF